MKSCPKHRIVSETDDETGDLIITAIDEDYEPLGIAVASVRARALVLDSIHVPDKMRRCGVGTVLYERLLKEACAMRKKLTSDYRRTEYSEGFWRKQVSKGRARCVTHPELRSKKYVARPGGLVPSGESWECSFYEMLEECPQSSSLAGRRRRRRRR